MFYPRATVAEIDLKAFRYNIKQIRTLLKPGVLLMAVIKANAYGHGLERIAQESEKAGVDWLGVSCIYEVIKIRRAGVRLPVLNLGPLLPQEAPALNKYDYRPTISNWEAVEKLAKLGKKVRIHLKVDSGLNRIGLQPQEVLPFIKKVKKLKTVEIEGLFTHFANADESEREATEWQLRRFTELLSALKKNKIKIPLVHAANSGATLWFPQSHFNMVRVGTLPFGFSPNPSLKCPVNLKPVLSLKTKITHLKTVPIHTPLSYGWTFYTRRKSVIASLAVGYADGFRRAPVNWGRVLVKGRFAPLVGRVCMDQSLIDVTDIPGVKIGDEAVLIGRQGKKQIMAQAVAERLQTIPHEVLAGIAERVTRIYKG